MEQLGIKELEESRPLCSQNVWQKWCDFYMNLDHPPRILEYGSGVSTYFHLKNLLKIGGSLTSIEHNPQWWRKVREALSQAFDIGAKVGGKDLDVLLSGTTTFHYRLRRNHGQNGCGTFKEFREYVTCPQGKFDLIIIDGRARKACVNYIIDNGMIGYGGLLVLCEAGRGDSRWPKKNQMEGTWDYQPEVKMLLDLGGEIIDGTGRDRWDNWTPNREPMILSNHFPMEALFYTENGRVTSDMKPELMRR